MALAGMIALDESLFICDIAETYHILDYKALPVSLLEVLASGLGENSRIARKRRGVRQLPTDEVLAIIADNLTVLRHLLTDEKKRTKIELLSNYMHDGNKSESARRTGGFNTGAEFETMRKHLLEGIDNG